MSNSNISVNDRVFIPTLNLSGYLRFLGSTDFKEGKWAGVELDDAKGKNNGSVNGYSFAIAITFPVNYNFEGFLILNVLIIRDYSSIQVVCSEFRRFGRR